MQQSLPEAKIIQITINNEMLGKYASYKIQIGQNLVARRFNDFVHFYEALKQAWPGCFIPKLPEKQAVGNLTEEFLRTRRRMLQHFLDSLHKRKVLWNSPEALNFFDEKHIAWVQGSSQFHERTNNNGDTILNQYQTHFTDYHNLEMSLDMKCTYYDFQSFIFKTRPMIENFKKMCNNYVTAKANFNTEQLIFVNYVLPEFEKNLLFRSEKKFFEKVKPLDLMKNQKYDQVRKYQSDQVLVDLYILENDMDSHIIQFEQIRKWEDKIIKMEDKIRYAQLDLQQTINNQRNAVSKLFYGSKEKEILRLQNLIEQTSKEIESLKGLINITMGQVCLFEIPEFTQEKESSFFKLLKIVGTLEMEQLGIVGDFWQGILDSRLVSEIVQQQNLDSVIIVEQHQGQKTSNQDEHKQAEPIQQVNENVIEAKSEQIQQQEEQN